MRRTDRIMSIRIAPPVVPYPVPVRRVLASRYGVLTFPEGDD
jgi:hypothetical protein